MDYQASTPADKRVVEAMFPYFSEVFANPHSAEHAFGWDAAAAIGRAKEQVSSLIGAYAEEVFFTSGATESNNHVFQSLTEGGRGGRNKVLISAVEHQCVLRSAAVAAERHGLNVVVLPVDSRGVLDPALLARSLSEDVLMVSVMAVNNEIGTVQHVEELVQLTHAAGALFHCDGAQAFPVMEVDVGVWDVDFMSFSAHKMYGPKGVGALYVRSDLQDGFSPMLVGGGQQEGIRAGTMPTPLCVGFGVAADIMAETRSAEVLQLQRLKELFTTELAERGVCFAVNGATGERGHPGNLSITFQDIDAQHLLGKLQPLVAASTGSACNSGMVEHSHVLAAIGLDADAAQRTVRFSFGRFSDEQQIKDVVSLVAKAIEEDS